MIKKGDTLIEVTLAVGIFSMIAIAIVSVMSSGTANSQTALETTLAREEIDTQAEALRFIQASSIADKDSAEQLYTLLWDKITSSAVTLGTTDEAKASVLQFTPSSCPDLYNPSNPSNIFDQNAFVINPRALGDIAKDTLDTIFISSKHNSFTEATTYPRLTFGKNGTSDEGELATTDPNNTFYRAEGIYVIAVADQNTTTIAGKEKKVSAFYDFYIRTCWYGANANEPSTISTVIRLYNPQTFDNE